jgi:hypothetical protein
MLVVVFLVFVPLAFTEDFLEAVFGLPDDTLQERARLPVLDLLLLSVIWGLAWWRRRREPRARGLLTWWFLLGAGFTLAVDVATVSGLLSADEVSDRLFAFVLYLVALAILLAAVVGANPRSLLARRDRSEERRDAWKRFGPAIPLFVGTFAAWIGSLVWGMVLDGDTIRLCEQGLGADKCEELRDQASGWPHAWGRAVVQSRAVLDSLCSGAVDQEYFAQLSQVIPLLIVAVGFEAGVFKFRPDEPVQRAMTALTIALLCIGEVLAISTLPRSNEGCGNVLDGWHEYAAFVLTLEAVFVALALLAWAVVTASSGNGFKSAGKGSKPSQGGGNSSGPG